MRLLKLSDLKKCIFSYRKINKRNKTFIYGKAPLQVLKLLLLYNSLEISVVIKTRY